MLDTNKFRSHIAAMAPHQRARRGSKLLIEAADEIDKLREINRRAAEDWAEDDNDIRNQARRVLPEELCESSDGYHVPVGDVVAALVTSIEVLRKENEQLKQQLSEAKQ